jgi:glycosyltransferase involved in cell wall biosynthesis
VLQVITSLQRGGAERITLDLMAELPGLHTRVRLATLGRALREAFPAPPGTRELAGLARDPEARMAELRRLAIAFGADVVHGHLLTGPESRNISAAGLPLVLTVHNTTSGWPAGLAELGGQDAALLVGCARAVEKNLLEARIPVPIRSVQNGIALQDFQPTPERLAAGRRWRKTWGFGESDFVLIAVANPRPQKRLHRLPAILAALQPRLETRRARLVFLGEVLRGNPESEKCLAETRVEIARLRLESDVVWAGSVGEVPEALAAANVLVSCSAHEGLSLAQLEALAMGCSVVATDVGGAGEIAAQNPRFHLVPPEASAGEFAEVLTRCIGDSRAAPVSETRSLPQWSRQRMAARYRWLYSRAIAASRRKKSGEGIWLITNNFSTGGAQTSARRLLLGLHSQGVRVRAAVIEEDPAWPTPGSKALLDAGVPVTAIRLDPGGQHDAAIEHLLAALDSDLPQSVLFWNLRPAFKVALADALLNVPVFDVSPGEMYYESLDQYFARPHPRLGCDSAREYGALLSGVIVKYAAEAERAMSVLGAQVHVVPNGVPLNNGSHADPNGTHAHPVHFVSNGKSPRSGPLVFGTAARINPQKRLEEVLEALRVAHPCLPPCVLRVAGGVERGCADYADSLKAAGQGLPVEWLGEVSNLAAFHRELDAFIMVSEPAGCPNAMLEALAAGLPVIATDVGGASEQVLNGRTGLLVPRRDAPSLAKAMIQLATQPELRLNLSQAGPKWIAERFSLPRMIADYRRICGI